MASVVKTVWLKLRYFLSGLGWRTRPPPDPWNVRWARVQGEEGRSEQSRRLGEGGRPEWEELRMS